MLFQQLDIQKTMWQQILPFSESIIHGPQSVIYICQNNERINAYWYNILTKVPVHNSWKVVLPSRTKRCYTGQGSFRDLEGVQILDAVQASNVCRPRYYGFRVQNSFLPQKLTYEDVCTRMSIKHLNQVTAVTYCLLQKICESKRPEVRDGQILPVPSQGFFQAMLLQRGYRTGLTQQVNLYLDMFSNGCQWQAMIPTS